MVLIQISFFLIGQDDVKKNKSLFLSEKDSTAKLHVHEALERFA